MNDAPYNEFSMVSRLRVSTEIAWRHAVSPSGVNKEFWPVLRMTFPPGLEDLTSSVPAGERLGRCWLLLGGFLPIERDDVTFVEVDPGRRFLERSTMLMQRVWEHERMVTADGDGCIVTDRVRFEPRIRALESFFRVVFRAVFAYRHRSLRRLYG